MTKRRFTDIQEKVICDEYFSKEKPTTIILAKKWSCNHLTISNVIKRNGFSLRTHSESCKGKKAWNKNLTKETDERVAKIFSPERNKKISEKLKGKPKSEEHKRKISVSLQGENSPMYGTHLSDASKKKIRDKKIGIPRSEETKKKMSDTKKTFTKEKEQQICNEYFSEDKPSAFTLSKKWNCSPCVIRDAIKRCGFSLRTKFEVAQTKEARKRKSIQLQKIMKDPKIREKISKANSTPKAIQQSLKNGHGNHCYYDNEFFPSIQERDCYIELKKLGFKIDHNFRGRFDFLVNDKIVVEFHSFDFKLTDEQYYLQRRKLLDEYGYKDLKLIVIKDLKEIENNLNNI